MKTRSIAPLICVLFAFITVTPAVAQGGRAKVLQTVMKVLVGAGAAGALANGAEAEQLEADNASVVERMQQQGVDLRNGAIFSTYFTLNGNADAVYWADIFSKPDIYMIVSIEGQGDFLIPKYISEYAGQPVLENIVARQVEPGRKIVIYVLDEDSTSDSIWNNILRTKVSFNAGADVAVCKPINISVGASGSIQLVDQYVTLDSPEFVAVAEFMTPDTDESVWAADGILKDEYNRDVGRIQFAQIWKADSAVIDAAEAEVRSSGKSKVFWYGLGTVLFLVFGKMLFSSEKKAA